MPANETQVAGRHYLRKVQHWDFVVKCMGNRYLEGQITKYVFRWKLKNGIVDLDKALHFLDKLVEEALAWRVGAPPYLSSFRLEVLDDFVDGLPELEQEIIKIMATWQQLDDLLEAKKIITELKNSYLQQP